MREPIITLYGVSFDLIARLHPGCGSSLILALFRLIQLIGQGHHDRVDEILLWPTSDARARTSFN